MATNLQVTVMVVGLFAIVSSRTAPNRIRRIIQAKPLRVESFITLAVKPGVKETFLPGMSVVHHDDTNKFD